MNLKTKEEILQRVIEILKRKDLKQDLINDVVSQLNLLLDNDNVRAICSNEGFYTSLADLSLIHFLDVYPTAIHIGINQNGFDNSIPSDITSLYIDVDFPRIQLQEEKEMCFGITSRFYIDKNGFFVARQTNDEFIDMSKNPNRKDFQDRYERTVQSQMRVFNQNGGELGRNTFEKHLTSITTSNILELNPTEAFRMWCPSSLDEIFENGAGSTTIILRDSNYPACLFRKKYDGQKQVCDELCYADTQRETLDGTISPAYDVKSRTPLGSSVQEYLQNNPNAELSDIVAFVGEKGGYSDSFSETFNTKESRHR